ncbi:MAG: LiaF transmembrane domain-containing protein [Halobacteriota archaeon]
MVSRTTGRFVSGLLIVLFGLLLLASTTDALPTASLWSWVPLLFVLLGLWAIVKSGGRNVTGPVMIVAVAGIFQLRNLGLVSDAQIGTWWPLFVVLFGVLVLVGRSRRRRLHLEESSADDLSMVAVFGGSQRRVTAETFVGGTVVSIFGGSEIDLRDAAVESPPAVIEALSLFGGLEVRVPEDWTVSMETLTLFGASEDNRPRTGGGQTQLVITGLTLFGGVEVLD